MDPAEDLLRRIAFNDERILSTVLARGVREGGPTSLTPRVESLVQLAALLAMGAATPLLRETVTHALTEGVTTGEVIGVLVAVGPAVGLAGLVASAPKLAAAIGYDLENGHGDHHDELGSSGDPPVGSPHQLE